MDLNFLIPLLGQLAEPVIAGAALFIAGRVWAWLGMKQTDLQRNSIHSAALAAVRFAVAKLENAKINLALPGASNPIMNIALSYLQGLARDRIAKLTPEEVESIILAQFPIVAAEMAVSEGGTPSPTM